MYRSLKNESSSSQLVILKAHCLQVIALFVWVSVCVCVYVVYEDTNLYNDIGMT